MRSLLAFLHLVLGIAIVAIAVVAPMAGVQSSWIFAGCGLLVCALSLFSKKPTAQLLSVGYAGSLTFLPIAFVAWKDVFFHQGPWQRMEMGVGALLCAPFLVTLVLAPLTMVLLFPGRYADYAKRAIAASFVVALSAFVVIRSPNPFARRTTATHSEAPVTRLTFSPDGRWLAGAGAAYVRMWDVASGKERYAKDLPSSIEGIAFNEKSDRLWVVRDGSHAWIHYLSSKSESPEYEAKSAEPSFDRKDLGPTAALRGADDRAWSPFGTFFRSATGFAVFDPRSRKVSRFEMEGGASAVCPEGLRLALSPSARYAAFSNALGRITVWDRRTPTPKVIISTRTRDPQKCSEATDAPLVAILEDAQLLASCSGDKLQKWKLSDGTLADEISVGSVCTSLTSSTRGDIAVGAREKVILFRRGVAPGSPVDVAHN